MALSERYFYINDRRSSCVFLHSSLFTLFLFIVCFSNAYAAANSFTNHSRANCFNNESISWDGRAIFRTAYKFDAAVISQHFPALTYFSTLFSPYHLATTGAQFDRWRVAAIHIGEGSTIGVNILPGHIVRGYHWLRINSRRIPLSYSFATDCNLSQGFVQWGPTQ